MFLTKWPHDGWWKHWVSIAEIDTSESPSKIEPGKSNSFTKWTTLLAARVSNANTNEGRGIILDRATLTSPRELWTTTPIPAAFRSPKTAPSKFVLRVLGSRGFQIALFGGCFKVGFPAALGIPWGTELPGPRV